MHRARLAAFVLGLVLAAGWSVVLARPEDPGAASSEVGYLVDLRRHALDLQQATVAVGRAGSPSSEPGEALTQVLAEHRRLVEDIDRTLASWGVEGTDELEAMAWMGHVVVGAVPGSVDQAALGPGDLPAFLAALVEHANGGLIMGRGLLGLSDEETTSSIARTALGLDARLLDRAQARRAQMGLPTVSAVVAMTTDPGNLDHGLGPLASAGPVLENVLRLMPLAVGVALIVGAWTLQPRERRWRPTRLLAAAGLTVAGLVHLGLVAPHYDEAVASGVFFALVFLVEIGLAAGLVTRDDDRLLVAAAAVSGFVVAVYGAFRLVPAPGIVGPVDVDAMGLVSLAAQLMVVAVWAFTRSPAPRPARAQPAP